jgi:hypothetical protein
MFPEKLSAKVAPKSVAPRDFDNWLIHLEKMQPRVVSAAAGV